jgi:hypothetical protein
MSRKTVEDILQRIDQLPDEDRVLLEKQLSERAETEWRQAADDARQAAREKGIDQAAIDQAVDRVRYPK